MTAMPKFSRRSFIVSSAAAAGGLALGLRLPFGPEVVRAQDGSPEINAWVVIRPDDTVVVVISGNGLKTLSEQPVRPWPERVPCNPAAMEEVVNDFRQSGVGAAH